MIETAGRMDEDGTNKSPAKPREDYHDRVQRQRHVKIAAFSVLVVGAVGGFIALFNSYDIRTNSAYNTFKYQPPLAGQAGVIKQALNYACGAIALLLACISIWMYYVRARRTGYKPTKLIPLRVFVAISLVYPLLIFQDGWGITHKTYEGWAAWIFYYGPVFWFGRAVCILPLSALLMRIVLIYYFPRVGWSRNGSFRENLNFIVCAYMAVFFVPLVACFIYHSTVIIGDPSRFIFVGLNALRKFHPIWHYIMLGFDSIFAYALFLLHNDLQRHDLELSACLLGVLGLWWFDIVFCAIRSYSPLANALWPHYIYLVCLFAQSILFNAYWLTRGLPTRETPRSALFVFSSGSSGSTSTEVILVPHVPGMISSKSKKFSSRATGLNMVVPTNSNQIGAGGSGNGCGSTVEDGEDLARAIVRDGNSAHV